MAADARVRFTKMVIRESFIHLNREKPIEKITVKEICDRAEINRSTFYRNYSDVYDLRDQIENDMVQRMREFLMEKDLGNMKKTILTILRTMKEHQSRYLMLHDIPSNDLLARIIHESFEDKKEYLGEQFGHLSETEQSWYYKYICCGTAAIMISWAKQGMKEDPEAVCDMICRLLQGSTAAVAKEI